MTATRDGAAVDVQIRSGSRGWWLDGDDALRGKNPVPYELVALQTGGEALVREAGAPCEDVWPVRLDALVPWTPETERLLVQTAAAVQAIDRSAAERARAQLERRERAARERLRRTLAREGSVPAR